MYTAPHTVNLPSRDGVVHDTPTTARVWYEGVLATQQSVDLLESRKALVVLHREFVSPELTDASNGENCHVLDLSLRLSSTTVLAEFKRLLQIDIIREDIKHHFPRNAPLFQKFRQYGFVLTTNSPQMERVKVVEPCTDGERSSNQPVNVPVPMTSTNESSCSNEQPGDIAMVIDDFCVLPNSYSGDNLLCGESPPPNKRKKFNSPKPLIKKSLPPKQLTKSHPSNLLMKLLRYQFAKSIPPNQLTKFHPPNQLTESHRSNQLTKSHPPNQLTKSHPPNQLTKSHPPNQLTKFLPPNQLTKSTPPNQLTKSHPPNQLTKSHPPNQLTKSHPPNQLTKSHPPIQLTKSDPPNQPTKSDLPNQLTESHPLHQLTESHSPYQLTKSPPPQQAAKSHPPNKMTESYPPNHLTEYHPLNQLMESPPSTQQQNSIPFILAKGPQNRPTNIRETFNRSCGKVSPKYKLSEDLVIIRFILNGCLERQVGGNVVWKKLEEANLPELRGRSWQSLKERFRKQILLKSWIPGVTSSELRRLHCKTPSGSVQTNSIINRSILTTHSSPLLPIHAAPPLLPIHAAPPLLPNPCRPSTPANPCRPSTSANPCHPSTSANPCRPSTSANP